MTTPTSSFMDLMRQPAHRAQTVETMTVAPAGSAWQAAVDAIEPTLPRSPEFLAAQAARAERIAEHDRHNYQCESAQFERMQKEKRDGK